MLTNRLRIAPLVLAGMLLSNCLAGLAAFDRAPVNLSRDLSLRQLADRIWLYQAWAEVPPWGRIEANGLLIREDQGFIMVNSPWNESNTRLLAEWTVRTWRTPVTGMIATHGHADNIGGMVWLQSHGVAAWASDLTIQYCRKTGLPLPDQGFSGQASPEWKPVPMVLHFPGAGHTSDNIVVWLPGERILFAGCLVKDMASANLGNTAEADLQAWPTTLRRLQTDFPQAELVIPGHGPAGGRELLSHTLGLFPAR